MSKSDPLPYTWNTVYNLVSKYHVDASADEQEELLTRLWEARAKYYSLLFQLPEVGEYLLSLWNTNRKTPSKLAADYNSSKKGHNAKINKRINDGFNAYMTASVEDKPGILMSLNISHRVLLSHDMVALVKDGSHPELFNALNKVDGIREDLTKSVTKMVSDIAIKFAKIHVNNAVSFDYDDLFQQGMLAAYDATMLYAPDPTASKPAKWFSFVFSWVVKKITVYTADHSRLVSIPRYVIERWNIVNKAMSICNSDDSELVSATANEIKSKALDAFTPLEVDSLSLLINSSPYSLDYSDNEDVSLKDTIPDENADVEESMLDRHKIARVFEALTILSPIERTVIVVRWGLENGVPMSLEQTVLKIKETHGVSISKEKVLEIDSVSRMKLKDNLELKLLWEE